MPRVGTSDLARGNFLKSFSQETAQQLEGKKNSIHSIITQ